MAIRDLIDRIRSNASVLDAVKAVDGSGSNLDADLLDGQSGAYYLDSANATGVLGVSKGGTGASDAATARTNLGISATNTPSTAVGGISATDVQAALQELDTEKLSSVNGVMKDSSTGAMYMPYGTTAQRPSSPSTGYMRFNTDLGKAEVWNGSVWSGVGGGATGGGSDTVFVETSYAVTQNYTITAGKSAITVGDANGNVSIADGVTVTVPDGSIWVVQGV